MMKGVQVVGASHGGVTRAYCSHWVCQVSFDEPILMASVSPRHDTHPLIRDSGVFSVSVLAGDQVAEGQYFSYPGRKYRYLAPEYLTDFDGLPMVTDCIAALRCEVFETKTAWDDGTGIDHDLFFARGDRHPRRASGRAAAAVLIAPRMAGHGRQGPRSGDVDPRRVNARLAALDSLDRDSDV